MVVMFSFISIAYRLTSISKQLDLQLQIIICIYAGK